ncbi:Prenylated Rab acceptor 1 [Colletotrichum tropicale]|nr:Prenylated Rab acceptor 1 [Colletotrichum tropicale]
MARIQIPIDALTSRLNIQDRFNSMRSGGLTARFANLRPVGEFFDMKRLSKPGNFGEVQSRWNYNLSYFSSNYSVVFLMLSIYALLTNWLLLFDIIFVVAGMFLIGKLDGRDLEIGTFRASTSQLWTGLLVIAIPVGLFASPFSTLLWLIGASGVVILGHAAFMDKPIDEAFSGEASEDEDDSSEDDSEEDDDSSEDEFEIDWDQLSPMEREEALVQTALARIRRAQEKGRADVKLNKGEMAALERHKKRMAKEARKQERKRRKEKEQRYSIPLSQLQAPIRRRSPTADDDLPLHPSPGTFDAVQNRGAMPPVGYFPPPNASRTRHRSSTSSSQRPPSGGERGSSPFQYPYVGSRKASDNMSPASSTSSKSKSKAAVDPFQFQTEGSSAQGVVARRNVSGSTDGRRTPTVPATSRVTRSRAPPPESASSSDSSSEESTEESTSDGTGNGAQIVEPAPPPPQTRRGRREAIVVEEAASREPARESSRGKKSSNPSPSKRKPVASRKKKK